MLDDLRKAMPWLFLYMLSVVVLISATRAARDCLLHHHGGISNIKVGVGLNKQSAELGQAIMDGLAALRADGTEKAIYDKYHFDYKLAMPLELLTK